MSQIEVFEPALCCPTGVCGVRIDPVLAQFNADLQALQDAGVAVLRHNLGHDPGAFAANPAVIRELDAGLDRLAIVTLDGHIISTGLYPSRAQLTQRLAAAQATADPPQAPAGGCGCAPGACG